MNKSYLLLPFVASIGLTFRALADSLIDLPADGKLSCSVEVATSTPGSAAPPTSVPGNQIKRIEITRDGNLQRDVVTRSSGGSREVWRVLDVQLLLAANDSAANKSVNIFPTKSPFADEFTPRILALDRGSLSWITPSTLVGKENKDGKDVFHYHAPVFVPGILPRDPPRQVFYDAWIDAKTLAPVEFGDGDVLFKLTFSPTPADSLVLPDRFQKVLEYYQRANTIGRRL
jgi:hypothetical protein